jgi:hypothetical protein
MNYTRFGAAITITTFLMYGLMRRYPHNIGDVRFSTPLLFVALTFVAISALAMLMFKLRKNMKTRANIAIPVGSVLVLTLSLIWFGRGDRNGPPNDNGHHAVGRFAAAATGSWTPIGYWAEKAAGCLAHPWLIARTNFASAPSRTCILHDRGALEGRESWRATCRGVGRSQITRLSSGEFDRLAIRNPYGETALVLVRCGASDTSTNNAQFKSLQNEAATLDGQIAAGDLVEASVAKADGIFLVRSWRQRGEIVKIVAPIGGGPFADRDRAFYFHPGDAAPFLIRSPNAVFVLAEGRISGWFSPDGRLVSNLVTTRPNGREQGLLAQASALRRLAEPAPMEETIKG